MTVAAETMAAGEPVELTIEGLEAALVGAAAMEAASTGEFVARQGWSRCVPGITA